MPKHAELSLADAALWPVYKGPACYSPLSTEAARERQKNVLQAMNRAVISPPRRRRRPRQKIDYREPAQQGQASYFVDYLINIELARYFNNSTDDIYRSGLEIYTTLDASMQQAAEEVVARIPRQRIDPQGCCQPQGALVALDPTNGFIKALVGGRDFSESQLNRVFSRRSPGSAFKPFVYAAALEEGKKATTTYLCEPLSLEEPSAGKPYEPTDYGGSIIAN